MKAKIKVMLLFVVLLAGLGIETYAQTVQPSITAFFRQRFYDNINFDINGALADKHKYTVYEGLYSLTYTAKISDKITTSIGVSGFVIHGSTRPWDIGSAWIGIKDFFNLPLDFLVGMWRNVWREGFIFGQLRTYGVQGNWKLGKNLTLNTWWCLENEIDIGAPVRPGPRHEDWQTGVLNWKTKSSLVQLGVFNFKFGPVCCEFLMPYISASGKMGGFSYLTEWGYQTGSRTTNVDQKALGGYFDGQYILGGKLKPWVGVRYYRLPGDDPSTPGKYEGWNKLYHTGTLFLPYGEIVTRLKDNNDTNMNILQFKAGLSLSQKVGLVADIYVNSRDKVAAGRSKNFGTEFDFGLDYLYMKGISFQARVSQFSPGKYFGTGAKGVTQFRLQTIYGF